MIPVEMFIAVILILALAKILIRYLEGDLSIDHEQEIESSIVYASNGRILYISKLIKTKYQSGKITFRREITK